MGLNVADRSVEMEDAEYWLALWRHRHDDELPPFLGVSTVKQAIMLFHPSCHGGRDEKRFLDVFGSGMGTFRRALPDCRGVKPRQQATLARARGRSESELWNSLRDRCGLHHLPAAGDTDRSGRPTPEPGSGATPSTPAEPTLPPDAGADLPPAATDNRSWTLQLIADRRGQTAFRDALFARFGGRCVVSGCELADVLEAAHIKPYAGEPGDQNDDNGLLLRADLHTLFDLHLIGIHPEMLAVEWHPRLSANPHYRPLTARPLVIPTPNGARPRAEVLRDRYHLFREQLRQS